ncbi:hypothetical protein [Haloarchaeobius amylolyticus]|uniref:hypothetical protein n=1 Tax=Haloarchaeobius amylolyticus TaxID=1198296 RepID=UPI00226FEE53|nr:hypothetical protein [Haloarchaeobius amylolyticus]
MTEASRHDQRTRRTVLTSVAATLGSAAVGTAAATGGSGAETTTTGSTSGGGSGIRREMAFEAPEDFEGDYVGNYLVIADEVTSEVDTSAVEQCGLTSWDPSNTVVYEAVLSKKLATDPPGAEVRILTNGEKDHLEAGSVFIVSDAETCGNGYVGVDTEAVSEARIPEGTETTAPPSGDESGSALPGFETPGAVAGIASLLALARWRAED